MNLTLWFPPNPFESKPKGSGGSLGVNPSLAGGGLGVNPSLAGGRGGIRGLDPF